MAASLADIDKILRQDPGFRIVERLAIAESGVDPIGLRQLNLDLMDETVPGINNVTMHIRPYAFMAWAWWKARQVGEENEGVDPQEMADLVARYETIYAWAHSLAGNPFRGASALRAHLPLKGDDTPFFFEGTKWEQFKKKRTSLMAPTEYGPSIKALHFLQAKSEGAFRCSDEAERAVHAIDAVMSSAIPARLLARKAPAVRGEEIESLAELLPVNAPGETEKEVFRFLFYDAGATARAHKDMRRRKATIDLLHEIMPGDGSALSIPEIRRRFASGAGMLELSEGQPQEEARVSALLFAILQARQLQRLAIETMMLWVERSLSDSAAAARNTDELAAAAQSAATTHDELAAGAASTDDYMDAVEGMGAAAGWPRAASVPPLDIVALMDGLHAAQRKDVTRVPALALRAFAIVYAITKSVRGHRLPEGIVDPIEARPDRLPMGIMVRRIDAMRRKPLVALWRDVIEHWIIAQHVHWSAVRGGDGKKRLRIGLEGSGWIRVRPDPSAGFRATPDRLLTLLSLGSECGLFVRGGGSEPSFGRPI